MAYNSQKLHCKIQAEKLNRYLNPADNADKKIKERKKQRRFSARLVSCAQNFCITVEA